MKEYYVINAFNGLIIIVTSRNRFRAMQKGRAWFGTTKLHLYAR
jgi:hypothetical protein